MEGFFYSCSFFDSEELRELLLRRYHQLDFIKDMELIEFIDFVKVARARDQKEWIHAEWCASYMGLKPEYRDFEAYYALRTGANIDTRSTEDIVREIEEAHKGVDEWKYSN